MFLMSCALMEVATSLSPSRFSSCIGISACLPPMPMNPPIFTSTAVTSQPLGRNLGLDLAHFLAALAVDNFAEMGEPQEGE